MSGRDSTVLTPQEPAHNKVTENIDVKQLQATYGKAIYIKVFIHKLHRHEWCYLDPGSQVTLLPSWIVRNDDIQLLSSDLKAQSASGHMLKPLGRFYSKLHLGSNTTIELPSSSIEVVENLNGRPILGTDILFRHHSDLTVSINRRCIVMDNQTAGVDIVDPKPQNLSPPQALQVCVMEDIVIPAWSERQVAVQIKHKVLPPATFLVSRSFTNTEPQLCIGSSLYHMNTNDTELPILLLNPHNVEVTVKANTVIVKIEEVTTPSAQTKPIAARVKVHQKPSRTTQKRVEQIASMMGVDKLTKAEQPKAKELISRFQNVFALDSSELGLTHLTTFDIQTGDAVPVATQRRRTP